MFKRKPRLVRDLQRLQLHPGDVILVRCDRSLSVDDVVRVKETVENVLPGHRCLVVDSGLELSAVGRSPGCRTAA